MSSTPFYLQNYVIKPVVSGIVASLMDHFLLNIPNKMENAIFGASVMIGTVVGDGVSPYLEGIISPLISDSTYWSGKTLSRRAIELMGGVGVGFYTNKLIFQNDPRPYNFNKKLGIILASQIVGEIVSDTVVGQPVSYLI